MTSLLSSGSKVDFVLVTALPEERDALLNKLSEYRQLPPTEDDIRTYYQADLPITLSDNSIGKYRVIVMCLLGMGRVQAVTATADAIRRWQPRYILLVGIAGGIAARNIRIGDVLISEQIVDYELQKLTPQGPEVRWEVQRADARLLDACNNYRDESWQETIQIKRPDKKKPRCHAGPIASGDKIIAFSDVIAKYNSMWPKLVGVEMEAAGVATAAFQSSIKPGFFMVRGVSDLADENKNSRDVEKWRLYACSVAASFAIGLLKSGPVPLAKDTTRTKTRQVEIILEGEFSEFTSANQRDIVSILATVLSIDSSDIRVLRVDPGSIKIVIELPDIAANHFHEMAAGRDFKIDGWKVKSVLVEGRETIKISDKIVGIKVLILDDDSDYRNYYTKWVSDMGFYPMPISNLSDAQNIFESQEVDIAIIDLFLGEQSDKVHPKGLLLIREIIERNNNGKSPLVMVVTGDPRATPGLWEEISEYMRRGVVVAVVAKDNKQFKEKFQSELKAVGEKIKQDFKVQETNSLNNPVTAHPLRVFLCHSSGDKDSVRGLYRQLKTESDIDPWLDEEKILPGQDWDFEIENALRDSDAIIVCCSTESVNKEGYVQKEVKRALDIAEEKPEGTIFIIPLKLNACELPRRISRWQSVNLFDEDGYDKLLRALRHRASKLVG